MKILQQNGREGKFFRRISNWKREGKKAAAGDSAPAAQAVCGRLLHGVDEAVGTGFFKLFDDDPERFDPRIFLVV